MGPGDRVVVIGSGKLGSLVAQTLALLVSGEVDPRPLLEPRYSLDDGLAAFEHAARPGVLKVLIEP